MSASTQSSEQTDPVAVIQSWVDDASVDGDMDAYAGKRRWARVRWQVPVTIETRPAGTQQKCHYVTSRDVSAGGFGVWCNQPIEPGTKVRLSVHDGSESVDAQVKQCTETVGGFIIGVEFQTQDKPC